MGSALHNGSIYHKLEYSCHTSILISRRVAQIHIVRGFAYLDTTPLAWRATKSRLAMPPSRRHDWPWKRASSYTRPKQRWIDPFNVLRTLSKYKQLMNVEVYSRS